MRTSRGVKKSARRPSRLLAKIWPPSRRSLIIAGAATAVVASLPALYFAQDRLPQTMQTTVAFLEREAIMLSAGLGLTVQEIFVEGRAETPGADVLAVLELSRNAPILSFSPEAARIELEKLPWVKSASIERRLPDTVYVRLSERQPLALWQRHGKLSLIDTEGVEIPGIDPVRFGQLPVVVGQDAPSQAPALIALLETEPDLKTRITAAVRTGGRRWTLRFDAGDGRTVEVLLPEVNPGAAWSRLAELERAGGLFERAVTAVDLRMPDRLVVRVVRETPPPVPPKRGAKPEKKPT